MRPNRGKMCLHAPKKGCRQPTGFLTLLLADDFFMLFLSKNRPTQLRNGLFAAAFNRTFWYWNFVLDQHRTTARCLQSHLLVLKHRKRQVADTSTPTFNRTFWYWNQSGQMICCWVWLPSIAPFGIETELCFYLDEAVRPFNRTFWYWNITTPTITILCFYLQSHLLVLKPFVVRQSYCVGENLQSHLLVLKPSWTTHVCINLRPSIAPFGIETQYDKRETIYSPAFNRTFWYWNRISQ